MANKKLFKSAKPSLPTATTVNNAGGIAYQHSDEQALAQFAMTGTFNNTFYVDAETQLSDLITLTNKVSPEFLAKCAIYAREKGFMKDTSATMLAVLLGRDTRLFKLAFPRVINNGKMLRNFCQVVRSGVTGRKSFGNAAKVCIQNWLESRSDKHLLEDSVGNDPSLPDILKMVHPRPTTPTRAGMYSYLLGKELGEGKQLPENVLALEAFKKGKKGSRTVPEVPFQLLTALDLSDQEWLQIAKTAPWHMTRMNLNTFSRHNVLKDSEMVKLIANRLRDEREVARAKVFPYQLLAAYQNVESTIPVGITNALQDAMEVATKNVPQIPGKVYVMVDSSGSMTSPVTGYRKGSTTKVTCNQVAALIAATVLRANEETEVAVFDTSASFVTLNPRDSVMTNTNKVNRSGGGTDCGCAMRLLNSQNKKGDLVIMVSDNESWSNPYGHNATNLQVEWQKFKIRNPKAKLVCIDITPGSTAQAKSSKDTLNIGGFSDNVFTVISEFIKAGSEDHWTKTIQETVNLG